MYFVRFKRLPFVLGVMFGFFWPFEEPYAREAHLWGLICLSLIMVEHVLIVCLSVRFGGWREGLPVAGLALLRAGMTLPEFYRKAREVYDEAYREWQEEQRLISERAAAHEEAVRAAAAAVAERSRRYAQRLGRLMEGDAETADRMGRKLAELDPAAAEAQLARAERLRLFLEQARDLEDDHRAHLTELFSQLTSLNEADRAARAYLSKVRGERQLLREAKDLGVQAEVSWALRQHGEAAAEAVLVRARASAAREEEYQVLRLAVDQAPAHDRGFLKELLAAVHAQLANPRGFRKAAHALRQRLPK